ncbi:hypothetical protein BC941DRAFT_408265 [Chlamydoabsidia padenii]|nr:hypothetical protein BC941DRAFT_408265 [Chlamydoabsidia padenii]
MNRDEERQLQTSFSIPKLLSILDLSLIIPNKVSMARDQLAGERNYLTFLRFSCTLIVLGFTMILKFRLPYAEDLDDPLNDQWEMDRDQITTPLGYCFVAIGFSLFLYSFAQYYLNQQALIRQVNYIQAGWFSLTVMAMFAAFVIGVMILATIHSVLFTSPT